MSLIDEVGYSAASVDGIASVQEAEEKLVSTTDNNGQLSAEISGSGAIDNINGASITVDGGQPLL